MTGRLTLPEDLREINVRDFFEEEVRRGPERPFLVSRENSVTYGEADAMTDRAAAAWQELGVGKGDRIAFMADNSLELVVAWLGLAKLGAVFVAVNTRFKAGEVRYLLEHARPLLAVASAAHVGVLRDAAAAVGLGDRVLAIGGGYGPEDLAERIERSSGRFTRPPLEADDVVSFIYTSGTTGHPKAVMQTHGNYVLTGQAYPTWLRLARGETLYTCLPLFHVNAQAYSVMGAIGLGGRLGLVERFSASRFWSDVGAMGADAFNYIGAMIAILLAAEPTPAERDHHVRITFGAPSFPAPQRVAIEERFGMTVISGFGMSETTLGMVENPDADRPSASIGRPRMHPDPRIVNEARVVDEDGRDVPDGVEGELLLRNHATMLGYFDDPERTAEVLRDGWLHTGDTVRRGPDGFYFFVDRKKDIVRRRGENVSSLEVELVLWEHPDVDEVAVVGVPAELTDEEILAVIVPRAGAAIDEAEIVAWCTERLADFKIPRYVTLVEALPRTPTHKVEKGRLRSALADSAGSWWDANGRYP